MKALSLSNWFKWMAYAGSFLGLGILIGSFSGGGMLHAIIALFFVLFVGFPLLIILCLDLVDCWRKRDQVSFAEMLFSARLGILLVVLGFSVGGLAILHYRKAEMERFVEEILPALDAHEKEFGRYPKDLREVSDAARPYYFREGRSFWSDGVSFHFYYEPPGSFMGGLMLSDDHRTWSVAD